jgi:ABC-type glycerol-3-phosphate transport system substrate-binding protein
MCAVSFVWAGGQQDGAEEKVRIVHFHWTETIYDPINNAAVDKFHSMYPNAEVKLLLFADADRQNKIRTALAADGEIDSFALTDSGSVELHMNKQMVEIIPSAFDKNSVEEVVDMWTPGAIETCGGYFEGKYYGIPFELSNYVGWINTAYMKEAGLDPKMDIPESWDDFSTICKKLTVDEGGVRIRNGFASNAKAGGFPVNVIIAMMQQQGFDWSTEEGILDSLDKPGANKVMETLTNFVVKDKIWDPGLFDNEREGFGNGLTATFLTGGTWYWGVLDTYSVPREDVAPFAYPRFRNAKRDTGGIGYGYSIYVSRLAKNPEMTFRWLDVMASQPNAFIKQGYHQPRTTLSDGSQGLDPDLAVQNIPYYKEVFRQELAATAVRPKSAHAREISDTVWAAASRVIFEGMSVDDTMSRLQNEMKSVFE